MQYNVNEIIESSFSLYDLFYHKDLKILILSLKNDLSLNNINDIKIAVNNSTLSKYVKHHIKIRLELLEDILNNNI